MFQKFASFCIWSPLVAIVVNLVTPKTPATSQSDVLASAVTAAIVPVIGILAGVFALFGMIRYGRARILWKSVIGLLIWALLAAAAIPAVNAVRAKVRSIQEQRKNPTPK